jgi:hypothetical protein
MATISNTPRPGYAYDSTGDVWYPIGTGPHTHGDYITQATAINPTIVDAKGDIIAATAADTVARLAVGANNTVLTADSSTATGLKWAASSGPTFANGVTDVATNENTTSGSYTDLTTAQSVTVTTGTRAIVFISTAIQNGATANAGGIMSFGISGATTRAAADITSIGLRYFAGASNLQLQLSGAFLVTGLTAGSNVFTAKFKAEGGLAAYFLNRRIQVLDLGS